MTLALVILAALFEMTKVAMTGLYHDWSRPPREVGTVNVNGPGAQRAVRPPKTGRLLGGKA